MKGLRAAYRRNPTGPGWEGLIKNEAGKILWACGHNHHYRHFSGQSKTTSAYECAAQEINRKRGALYSEEE